MTMSRVLARRFASTTFAMIPEPVRDKATLHIADAIGVGLAASTCAIAEPYSTYARTITHQGSSTCLADGRMVDASQAALVNGGLIHSLEFDDTHTASIIHGSSVILPTCLAMAEEQGLSGEELIRLYVVGYEALIRLGLSAPGDLQRRGFQATSVAGSLVAAAISASALGADENGIVAAMGIALSQASGSMEFLSNGSTVKSLHPGWAAHAGILAARLAASGLTGPESAIEGRFGFYALFADGEPSGRAKALDFDTIGTDWRLPEVAVKLYPACHYLHAFIEGALSLREQGIVPSDVESFVCRAPAGTAGVVCEPWADKQRPPSGHALRWSLPGIVATALIDGRVDLASFENQLSAAALDLAARMTWEPLAASAFPKRFDGELIVRTRDGGEKRIAIDDAYGNASRPVRPEEYRAKFLANASRRLWLERAEILAARLADLARADTVSLEGYLN